MYKTKILVCSPSTVLEFTALGFQVLKALPSLSHICCLWLLLILFWTCWFAYRTSWGYTFQKTTVHCVQVRGWKYFLSSVFTFAVVSLSLRSTVGFGEKSFSSTFCCMYCFHSCINPSHMALHASLHMEESQPFHSPLTRQLPAHYSCLSLYLFQLCPSQSDEAQPLLPRMPNPSLAFLTTATHRTGNFREWSTMTPRDHYWVVAENSELSKHYLDYFL